MRHTSQLNVLIKVIIGALTEGEAVRSLGLPTCEFRRLMRTLVGCKASVVPIAIDLQARLVEFLDLEGATFREPFFSETIARARATKPEPLNFCVDFDDFACSAHRHNKTPDALVFHVGRCGSTLLTNMLTTTAECVAVKEPEIVNHLLAAWLFCPDDSARDEIELLLKAAICYQVTAAGDAVVPQVHYRVLKLSAWNACHAKLLLDLFPASRAVFLCRCPTETVASLLYQQPAWFDLIERPRSVQSRFFQSLREVQGGNALSPTALFAHAWRSAAESALSLQADRLAVIQYDSLIYDAEKTLESIISHFGMTFIPERVPEVLATYSKDPNHKIQFEPNGRHRRPRLSPEQVTEVRAITDSCWQNLVSRPGSSRRAPVR